MRIAAATPSLRVAFGGRMQVGKTTGADHLANRHGFVKLALADPIKRIAVDDFGWDGAKDARGRRLLQEIGTVGRNYDLDIWLDRFADRLASESAPRLVVDDVRLAREVERLSRLGFICVRITRPAELVSTRSSEETRHRHETEAELDRVAFQFEIDNSESLAELYAKLDDLVARLEIEAIEAGRNRKAPPSDGAFGD